jgi:uncharacterized protein
MIRIVVDTNVVVSAALVSDGLPAAVLDLAANRLVLMVISGETMAEYEEVLRRPCFKLSPLRVRNMLATIRNTSDVVRPDRTLAISRDEADNRFYECADAGEADYLITGNTRHFPAGHKKTKIVTPREFIERIAGGLATGDE